MSGPCLAHVSQLRDFDPGPFVLCGRIATTPGSGATRVYGRAGGRENDRAVAGRTAVLEHSQFPHAEAGAGGRGADVAGCRMRRQSLAIYPWADGRLAAGLRQNRRDPASAADCGGQILLRINWARAPAGAKTAVHSHPGSEAFYVLAGQLSQRTPDGVKSVAAGQSMPGHGASTPMEVSSTGTTDLSALVIFLGRRQQAVLGAGRLRISCHWHITDVDASGRRRRDSALDHRSFMPLPPGPATGPPRDRQGARCRSRAGSWHH